MVSLLLVLFWSLLLSPVLLLNFSPPLSPLAFRSLDDQTVLLHPSCQFLCFCWPLTFFYPFCCLFYQHMTSPVTCLIGSSGKTYNCTMPFLTEPLKPLLWTGSVLLLLSGYLKPVKGMQARGDILLLVLLAFSIRKVEETRDWSDHTNEVKVPPLTGMTSFPWVSPSPCCKRLCTKSHTQRSGPLDIINTTLSALLRNILEQEEKESKERKQSPPF